MQITIHDVKNADELDQFIPVEGCWRLDGSSEDRSAAGVEQSVRNWMDAAYAVSVRLFHADGREITGDMPSEGQFLAIRQS
jgi:hypothetical protein